MMSASFLPVVTLAFSDIHLAAFHHLCYDVKVKPILQGPCCHDALSAKLIEEAGMPFAFMSGFTTAAASRALPDTGLISYGEMVATGAFNRHAGAHESWLNMSDLAGRMLQVHVQERFVWNCPMSILSVWHCSKLEACGHRIKQNSRKRYTISSGYRARRARGHTEHSDHRRRRHRLWQRNERQAHGEGVCGGRLCGCAMFVI